MSRDDDQGRLFWTLGSLMYVFYLVGHNPVSDFCYFLRDTYTENVYRYYIQLTGKCLLALHIAWIVWRLRMTSNRLVKAGLWLIFLIVTGYYYAALIKFAIEYVHFIQYCGLTIVIFKALKKRYLSAVLICLLLGLLDEIYQAYHPIGPLNWRDVLLNALGVVWGGLVLLTLEGNKLYISST